MSKDGGGFGTRGLYILLGFLCVAIVGLGVGIYFVINNNITISSLEITEAVQDDIDTCINNRKPEDCEVAKNTLRNIIKNTKDEDKYTLSVIYLSDILYTEDVNLAIETLDGSLERELSDVNRYRILDALLSLYEGLNDVDNRVRVLKLLVELPDSMNIERENWPYIKQMFIEELNRMEMMYET